MLLEVDWGIASLNLLHWVSELICHDYLQIALLLFKVSHLPVDAFCESLVVDGQEVSTREVLRDVNTLRHLSDPGPR